MPRRLVIAAIAALGLCLPASPALAHSHGSHKVKHRAHHKHVRKPKRKAPRRTPRRHPKARTLLALPNGKRVCLYASHHISMLQAFSQLVGRNIDCAMVFNDASPDWAGWQRPWFLNNTYADMSWAKWATAPGQSRQLVITQNLFPASENSADWLSKGAAGAYIGYAKTLATNLVAAGLGNAVIRLAHEANGNWYADSIPDTPAGDALWVQFWRNTVLAMKSVPGANFQFDWTVNAGYRNVPLSDFYPGDDVVDIVGVDAYDAGVTAQDRWSAVYTRPGGLRDVLDFARAHGKPLSIPEWGVEPAGNPKERAGGDDPAYVDGIASVVASNNVAYQAYFDSGDTGTQFFNSPLSIVAYRQHFGANGDAVLASDRGPQTVTPSPAPALAITGGPADGSLLGTRSVVFGIDAAPGATLVCSLDNEPWRSCSSRTSDGLGNLASGYHYWKVQTSDSNNAVSLFARTFTVSANASSQAPPAGSSPVRSAPPGRARPAPAPVGLGAARRSVAAAARLVAARLSRSGTVPRKATTVRLGAIAGGSLCVAVLPGWGSRPACGSRGALAYRRGPSSVAVSLDLRGALRRLAGSGRRRLTVVVTYRARDGRTATATKRIRARVRR